MKPHGKQLFPAADEVEWCPVCGHEWVERGPAHFTDCRFFSLDDDRDEERSGFVWNRAILSLPVRRTM